MSLLRIPAIHEAQKQLSFTFCTIFFKQTVFQKSEGRFFDKGPIDVKSVLTFEKWSLMAELKLKM